MEAESKKQSKDDRVESVTSCTLCSSTFHNVVEQREHVRSDWHGYNLKRKLKGLDTIEELEFESLIVERLDESISGSDSSESDSEKEEEVNKKLSTILEEQAVLHSNQHPSDASTSQEKKSGKGRSPFIWFSTPLLSPKTSLGVYRVLFDSPKQEGIDNIETLRENQYGSFQDQSFPKPLSTPNIFLCMVGGGHFAAMIVSLIPKIIKKSNGMEDRQAVVVAHKTIHRYTTRRKQGGSQSANDSAKGAAHSAGANIRRHNEAALSSEIRALLAEWKTKIDQCRFLLYRATGNTSRRILFGPYDGQVLRSDDPRTRSFPFTTRRATQTELMRAFIELTRVKISRTDEGVLSVSTVGEHHVENSHQMPLSNSSATNTIATTTIQHSKDEEIAMLHTSQLQALVRRSKAPAVLAYLTDNSLSPDFKFNPSTPHSNHHSSTPLHLASSLNASAVILSLLTKAGANPTIRNGEGRVPFDITGDRSARDAFRIARFELGEDQWNWTDAHCPPPISRTEASEREERERKEVSTLESRHRELAIERLKKESNVSGSSNTRPPENILAGVDMSIAERREQEVRGLRPETRARLEREKRARAAEERIRQMSSNQQPDAT